jgi:hypothetical protein
MQFTGAGLAVSLPAQELQGFTPSGSVFEAAELAAAPLSPDLRAALEVIRQALPKQQRLVFIARPEIFTHGVSLEWLQSRLQGITDHLALSDGSALRLIPQMRNHLFLYGLGRSAHAAAFARLAGYVPELFASFDSQLNTAIRLKVCGQWRMPTPVLLQAITAPNASAANRYFPHVKHRDLATGVKRMLKSQLKTLDLRARALYVPLTEAIASDAAITKKIALAVNAASYGASQIVMRLPRLAHGASLEARLMAALAVLGAVRSPAKGPAASIVFATEDPTPRELASWAPTVDLLLPTSDPFWIRSTAYYASFGHIDIAGARPSPAFDQFLNAALGRAAQRPRQPAKPVKASKSARKAVA